MPVDTSSVDVLSMFELRGFVMHGRKPTRVWTGERVGEDEYHGSCPWCGGTDRFMFRVPGGRYSCAIRSSGCGRYGNDVIDFIEEYEGMAFLEACEELGIEPDSTCVATVATGARKSVETLPPNKKWQERAATVILKAERYLFSAQGQHALNYLRARGFSNDLIKLYHLGYIPLTDRHWYKDPFDLWGLKAEDYSGCDGVTLPPGILIPWYEGSTIWRLQIRRLDGWKEGDAKYLPVLGSQEGLYNVDAIRPDYPLVLVEGAFDALAGQSATGERATFVATGSTTGARSARWVHRIKAASSILIGYDDDQNNAGNKGARYWLEMLPQSVRWVPWSHDINEMLQEGVDIGAWIDTGIGVAEQVQTPEEKKSFIMNDLPLIEVQEPEEEPFLCSVCGMDASTAPDDVFFEIDEMGTVFCPACWVKRQSPVAPVAMTKEQFLSIAEQIAGCLPACEILKGTPEDTIAIASETSPTKDFWQSVKAHLEIPPYYHRAVIKNGKPARSKPTDSNPTGNIIYEIGKPMMSREEWGILHAQQKYERPEEARFSHYKGGYADYCSMATREVFML